MDAAASTPTSSSTIAREEPYTIALCDLGPEAAARAGDKAARLGRALGAGFAVPEGFVVTTAAFRAFLGGAPSPGRSLAQAVAERLGAPDSRDPARIADTARAIAALVAATPLPAALVTEITDAYRLLGAGARVAVRSSAIGEDGHARSLAGHFDSFLDLAGEAAVLDGVKRCFGSAWSERVLAARLRAAPAPGAAPGPDAEMAVLVQRMVRGGRGGVLFTQDPVAGLGRMVAEYHEDGAEHVAGGGVMPSRLSFDRDAGGGEPLARDLAGLGRRLEALFGGPQDIEWAEDGYRRIYLLQTRPVTATAAPGRDVWTAANSQEAIEDPVTPLTYTFMAPYIERGRKKVFEILDVGDPPGGYMRLFFGRIYFNVNYFRRFLESIPGIPPDIFDLLLFGDAGEITFPRPPLGRRTLRVAMIVLRTWSGAIRRMDQFVRHLGARLRALAGADIRDLSDEGLLAHLARVSGLLERALNLHVLGSAMAGGHYLLLKKFLKIAHVAHDENTADELLSGTPGIETARSNAAIFELAHRAAALPAVKASLLSAEPVEALARLRRGEVAGGAEFAAALERFLAEFGHRAEKEAELMRPRWRESPGFILRAVRRFLELETVRNPATLERELAQRRRALARRIDRELAARGVLRSPARAVFRYLLRYAEESAPYRENLRFHGLRAFEKVRLAFLEIGRRLAARGALARGDDVFFLEAGEALSALGAGARGPGAERAHELARVAVERKAAYEDSLARPAPPKLLHEDGSEATLPGLASAHTVGGHGVAAHDEGSERAGRRYLEGVPVSSGIVTGRVRLVERLEDGWTLKPDEILLARAATPSWTPLFFFARGVILDIGGMLSHCAVIAREYGIPCVVGLKTATAVIKDGDVVTVDAFKGRVYIG